MLRATRRIRTVQIIFITFLDFIYICMVPKYKQTKKGGWRDIFLPFLMVGIVAAIVLFLVISNYRINQRRMELGAKIDELKAEIQELGERRLSLEAKVSQSDQESFLENEARERFNLKKLGEEVVTIVPAEEKTEENKDKAKEWWNPFSW